MYRIAIIGGSAPRWISYADVDSFATTDDKTAARFFGIHEIEGVQRLLRLHGSRHVYIDGPNLAVILREFENCDDIREVIPIVARLRREYGIAE